MPRSTAMNCPVCTSLHRLDEEYGPKRRRYEEEARGGWRRITSFTYDGVERLGSSRPEPMKRLYVREGGVNRPVGYICDRGHVVLDEPPEGAAHVVTRTWPPLVICTATGEVVSTRE